MTARIRPAAFRVGAFRAAFAAAALGAAGACFAQSLPAGVGECVERLTQRALEGAADDAADDELGIPRLGDVCAEVATEIDTGAWGQALGDVYAKDLTQRPLADLESLVARYERPAAAGAASSVGSMDSLDAVLAALELQKPDTEPGLWERFKKWLDEQFGANEGESRGWLEDWLRDVSVPERTVRYLLIALGALLVVTTVVLIVNELRIAGVLAGGALRKYSPLEPRRAPRAGVVRDFDDIARAPLARRPSLLLLLVLDRLRARADLSLRASLTHRELAAAASRLRADQSDALRAVAAAAERATFGGWQPAEREVDEVVATGRALVASLDGKSPGVNGRDSA